MIKNPGLLLEKVRKEKPMVHHLTNWVTIYDCANIVKTFGASPVMAHAMEESAQMAGMASALVLNIGTLTADIIESMIIAAQSANAKGIPVVLDVCGAGATAFRDEKSFEILEKTRIDVIKGNVSEIARIFGENVQTKGVDASEVKMDPIDIAKGLASKRNCTVVITGKTDILSDGKRVIQIKNGHDMMSKIVGTGCMAASVIGTFCAVEKDLLIASASALVCYEIAAEFAAKSSSGPGSFKTKLFDEVYQLDASKLGFLMKVEQC